MLMQLSVPCMIRSVHIMAGCPHILVHMVHSHSIQYPALSHLIVHVVVLVVESFQYHDLYQPVLLIVFIATDVPKHKEYH